MEFLSCVCPRYLSLDVARTCYCIDRCPLQVQVAVGAGGPVLTDPAETDPAKSCGNSRKVAAHGEKVAAHQKIVAALKR